MCQQRNYIYWDKKLITTDNRYDDNDLNEGQSVVNSD